MSEPIDDPEFVHPRRLAQVVLDQPSRDPDDDLSVLARQLQRADETIQRYAAALLEISIMGYSGAPDITMRRIARTALGLIPAAGSGGDSIFPLCDVQAPMPPDTKPPRQPE